MISAIVEYFISVIACVIRTKERRVSHENEFASEINLRNYYNVKRNGFNMNFTDYFKIKKRIIFAVDFNN